MKELGELPGHSNRVFTVKFNPNDQNVICSGGWDNTVQIYDIRKKGPIASIYGPHICGDAIDFKDDGHSILTGSYRQENVLELWDLRTRKKYRDVNWEGPKAATEDFMGSMEEDKKDEEDKENESPEKE